MVSPMMERCFSKEVISAFAGKKQSDIAGQGNIRLIMTHLLLTAISEHPHQLRLRQRRVALGLQQSRLCLIEAGEFEQIVGQ